MNSPVQEDDSVNFGHRVMSSQPLSIFSLWTKSLALLNETCRMACHPLRLRQLHGLGKLGYQGCVTTPPFQILFIRSLLSLFGFAVGKTGIVRGSDVSQVAHDIHHLVVTEQAYYPAACLWRFFFQRHHQVHDLARLGAAIQEIPDLDERCLTACPMVLLVYKTGAQQNGNEVVKGIVYIGDGHYGFRRFRWRLCSSRRR